MAYGATDEIEKLAYGGVKATTPPVVTTANNQATTIINLVLGLNADITTPSTSIANICNLLASEIVKNPKTLVKDWYEEAEILLLSVKDQGLPSETGLFANIRFI